MGSLHTLVGGAQNLQPCCLFFTSPDPSEEAPPGNNTLQASCQGAVCLVSSGLPATQRMQKARPGIIQERLHTHTHTHREPSAGSAPPQRRALTLQHGQGSNCLIDPCHLIARRAREQGQPLLPPDSQKILSETTNSDPGAEWVLGSGCTLKVGGTPKESGMIKLPAEQRTGRAKRGTRSPHCLTRSRGPGVQLGDTPPPLGTHSWLGTSTALSLLVLQ